LQVGHKPIEQTGYGGNAWVRREGKQKIIDIEFRGAIRA
jgi:hypothetical protein